MDKIQLYKGVMSAQTVIGNRQWSKFVSIILLCSVLFSQIQIETIM